MYNIMLHGVSERYGCDELVKVFINPDDFKIWYDTCDEETEFDIELSAKPDQDKNCIKRELYSELVRLTGHGHEWGILTGVRPVKLAGELTERYGREKAFEQLTDYYMLSPEKAKLITETYEYQKANLGEPPEGSVGVYIGIPFCPTRCLYCSFASNQVKHSEIERYLAVLHREIEYAGRKLKERGWYPESIYVGGGTPTTLEADELSSLIDCVRTSFDMSKCVELTVEAGRPDTIDPEKLAALKKAGVDRISINPQTMKDETLETIGRAHKSEDIVRAFSEARDAGIENINADVIAGLPGEDESDFEDTIRKIIDMSAENITVHTLAVKRASRLVEQDKDFHYRQADVCARQLARGRKMLSEAGYTPYYMYRQKHMAGALENVGYCRKDTLSVYNVRIMEEKQTIVALGAGAISKRYYKDENRLERIPNVTNYEIYIERFDEMLERKDNNLFQED